MINSQFGSPSKPLSPNPGLHFIRELIDYEISVVTYESLTDLVPFYLKFGLPATLIARHEFQEALKVLLNCLGNKQSVGRMDSPSGESKSATSCQLPLSRGNQ